MLEDSGPHLSDEVEDRGLPQVSVIVATLNERDNLPILVDRIRLLKLPSYEVVVVDDGSTDGTRDILLHNANNDSSLRPVFHEGRQSLLQAHCQGIRASRGDVIVVMDADLQHPPELIPVIVAKVQAGTDLVVGTRYGFGGLTNERSLARTAISISARLLARLLLRDAQQISDPISGFYGFRRKVFVPIDPRWRGYELLPFILATGRHLSVAEVPYTFQPRRSGSSKIVSRNFLFIRTFLTQLLLAARSKHHNRTAVQDVTACDWTSGRASVEDHGSQLAHAPSDEPR